MVEARNKCIHRHRCPHCGGKINPAAMLAATPSDAKAAAARENGRKGGRPRKRKPFVG